MKLFDIDFFEKASVYNNIYWISANLDLLFYYSIPT